MSLENEVVRKGERGGEGSGDNGGVAVLEMGFIDLWCEQAEILFHIPLIEGGHLVRGKRPLSQSHDVSSSDLFLHSILVGSVDSPGREMKLARSLPSIGPLTPDCLTDCWLSRLPRR